MGNDSVILLLLIEERQRRAEAEMKIQELENLLATKESEKEDIG